MKQNLKRIYLSEHQVDYEEATVELLIPQYHVILHNDSVHTMDFVADCLTQVFGFTPQKAWAVMNEAHVNEVAICSTEPLESAEFHCNRLLAFGLLATIEEKID